MNFRKFVFYEECRRTEELKGFKLVSGIFFSEALILASVNPQYDKRLFIEYPEKIQV